eukprot:g26642.t1
MTVPPGFTVELVASEPDIVNPVAMCFDEKGRAWITESLEYPRLSAGKGRDRIKVAEDTDGDGKMDKFTIFAEGLNIPSGIAVGYGGVWVANSPDLLFMQDTDGDGKADKTEVVVTGFGRRDTHELPNSLTWGPDGWLYGLNGVFNHSHVRYSKSNRNYKPEHPGWKFTCAMFRIHPRTRKFEVFAEGTSNPWGIAWNDHGEAFLSACVIDHLWHISQTGYYHRQGGPYPPHTWKLESIVKHKHQAAAYCGIHYYDSDAYPKEFRGKLYMGNIHGNCINADQLRPDGSTYFATPRPDFLTANDVWFMPVVQKTGPDGCLYVLDWYDRYHCYQDARRDPKGIDRLHGRLYRIRYKNTPRAGAIDLAKETDDQLIKRLQGGNDLLRQIARRIIAERSHPETAAKLERLIVDKTVSRTVQLNALWARTSMKELGRSADRSLFPRTPHPDPIVRAWYLRAAMNLAQERPDVVLRFRRLVREATRDESPIVKRQAAIAMRRFDPRIVPSYMLRILGTCGDDKLLAHLVWNNLRGPYLRHGDEFVGRLDLIDFGKNPSAAEMMPFLANLTLDQSEFDARLIALLILKLSAQKNSNAKTALTRVIEQVADRVQNGVIRGKNLESLANELKPFFRSTIETNSRKPVDFTVMQLAASMGNEKALEYMSRVLQDQKQARDRRLAAASVLVSRDSRSLLSSVTAILEKPKANRADFRGLLLTELARLKDDNVATVVLKNFNRLELELRPRAIELLTQRVNWSKQLLAAVGRKQVPANAINLNQARRLLAFKNDELTKLVGKHWGVVRNGRDPKRAEYVAQWKRFLRKNHGDPTRGEKVFYRVCGQCHKLYGKGFEVGPDITRNGRNSFDQLLSNVFDPSLVIGSAYRAYSVVTTKGRIVTGLLVEKSPQRVVLKVQGGKLETIARDDIEEETESKLSMMPEQLEKQLKPAEIADLFAFITLDKHPSDKSARQLPGVREIAARLTADPKQFAGLIGELLPGFNTKNSGGGVSLVPNHFGRAAVRTHPVRRGRPCVLSGTFAVPTGKRPRLSLAVSHNRNCDWTLIVKVNGKKALETLVGPKTTVNGWLNVAVDLSEYAGKNVNIELHNQPNNCRVASGQPTPELWDAIVLTEGDVAKSTTSRKWLMWFAFVTVACLLIAAGLKFSGGTPEDNADELDLARLSTQWHRDLSEGTQQVGFRSSSDLDVERYLRRRVEFPVRCPPRKDTGFIVSGAGVCRFEGQKAAYLVGKLDGNDVSIFILSRDALRRFPRQQEDLEQGDALSCVDGVYRTTMAAIDRNVVLAVGNASCTRLVVTFYPGMPPEVMEQDIMSRLQRWTGQSAGIEHQEAKAMQGVCVVKDFFHPEVSSADAMSQVSSLAMSDMFYLPPGTLPPMVMPFDPTASVPLCLVTVSNPDMDEKELYDVAYKNLRNNLQSIPGVIAPAVYGGKLRRILAYVRPADLAHYNLTIRDVHAALRRQNVIIPAGSAKIHGNEFYLYTNAIPTKVTELSKAPIKKFPDGSQLTFSDIGGVKDTAQIQTNKVRVNGRNLVYVPVYRQPGANTIEIVNRIKKLLAEILARLKDEKKNDPILSKKMENLTLAVAMDQSKEVRESVNALWVAGILGAFFAGLVVFLFLRNWRSTLVIVLAIPISILTSMIGLYFTGNTINAMTLGGLALAVGILIDQAIVVLDNIERHMQMGTPALDAADVGTREVAVPLFVSTVTFIVVFFPILFLSGLAKYLFVPLALAVLFAVLASFLIAIFFIPVAAAKLMKPPAPGEATAKTGGYREIPTSLLIRGYRLLLLGALRWKWAVLILSAVLFAGSMWLMTRTGQELFPPVDSGQFTIYVRAKSGTRIEMTEELCKRIENIIVDELGDPSPGNPIPYDVTVKKFGGDDGRLNKEEVAAAASASNLEMLISNIGVLMDWPAAYTPNAGAMDAFVLVQFKEDARKDVFTTVTRLRKRLKEDPVLKKAGVEFAFDTGGILTAALNMGEPSPIHMQIGGYSLDSAQEIARALKKTIASVEGTTDVRIAQAVDYPMIKVVMDRTRAQDLGISPQDVMESLVSSTNSSVNFDPAFWIDPNNGNHYFMGAQYAEHDINSVDSLRKIVVKNVKNQYNETQAIYLEDVADFETNHKVPAVVNHRNIVRVTDVFANVKPGYDLGSVVAEIERRLSAEGHPLQLKPIKDSRSAAARYPEWFQNGLAAVGLNTPTKYTLGNAKYKGFTLQMQGEIRSMRDSFVDFALGLVLATILVYLVMVAQFRSWLDPFIVLVTVPMGFIGVALTLWLTGTRLNIQSFMGIIMMIGIVVEYTIVLLDFSNHRLEEGADVTEAIVDAAIVRFRPILMTSVTTILALLPLAIGFAGGEADVPLARTIVGAVIAATLLPKFVVETVAVRGEDFAATPDELKKKWPRLYEAYQQAEMMEIDVGSYVEAGTLLAVLDIPEMADGIRKQNAVIERANQTVAQKQAAIRSASAEVGKSLAEIAQARKGRDEVSARLQRDQKELARIEQLGRNVDKAFLEQLQFKVAASKAALASAEQMIKSAEETVKVSKAAVDKAGADKNVAAAFVTESKAELSRLETLRKYASIRAPFSGTINRRFVDHGSFVRPAQQNSGAKPLFAITQTNHVRVVIPVPGRKSYKIRPGQEVVFHTIGGMPGVTIQGTITRSSATLDPSSRMMRAEMHLTNPATNSRLVREDYLADLERGHATAERRRPLLPDSKPPRAAASETVLRIEHQSQSPAEVADGAPSTLAISVPPEPAGKTPVLSAGKRPQIATLSLAEVLSTAGAENWAVQLAEERIHEASAKHQAAKVLWLPSLSAGIGYTKHDGQIQDTRGRVLDVSRNSLFVGGGAVTADAPTAAGSGGPARMFVDMSLADAIYRPRQTRHLLDASYAGQHATFNDTLLSASLAYYDLVRAHHLSNLAKENLKLTLELQRLTKAFADSGKGTLADVSRVDVDVDRRRQDVVQADMAIEIASAELARILRFDLEGRSSSVTIGVQDALLQPVEFISADEKLETLVAQAVSSRPEVSATYAKMSANWEGVRAEQMRPWIPNLHMGVSAGGFGGGSGSRLGGLDGRADVDLLAVWQVRNLGLGTRAARQQANSQYRQAHLEYHRIRDLVAAEVTKAYAVVDAQRRRVDIARNRVERALDAHKRSLARIRAFQGLPLETLQDVRNVVEARNELLDATIAFNQAQLQSAAMLDKFTILRSVDPKKSNHEPNKVFQTGNREASPRTNRKGESYPAIGSLIAKFRGANAPGMPPYVAFQKSRSHVAYAGDLGRSYDPFLAQSAAKLPIYDLVGKDTGRTSGADLFRLPGGLSQHRIHSRRELLKGFDRLRRDLDLNGSMEALDTYGQQAVDMVIGRRAQQAFDINREPEAEAECDIWKRQVESFEKRSDFITANSFEMQKRLDSLNTQLDERQNQERETISRLEAEIKELSRQRDELQSQFEESQTVDSEMWVRACENGDSPPAFTPQDDRKTRFISVLNLKGGVGKTTIVGNLASAFATGVTGTPLDVLVVDLDFQGTLSNTCVDEDDLRYRRTNALTSSRLIDVDAGLPTADELLHAFASPIPETGEHGQAIVAMENLQEVDVRQQMRYVVGRQEMRFLHRSLLHDPAIFERFHIVLFDCPPSLTTSSINALFASDFVLIPTTLHPNDVDATPRTLNWLRKLSAVETFRAKLAGIVVNKAYHNDGTIEKLTKDETRELARLQQSIQKYDFANGNLLECTIPSSPLVARYAGGSTPLGTSAEGHELYRPLAETLYERMSKWSYTTDGVS